MALHSPEALGAAGGDLFVTAAMPRSPNAVNAGKCRDLADLAEEPEAEAAPPLQ
jgi:hypothetical protein